MWQTSQFPTHFFVKSDGFFDKKYHFTSQNFNFVLKNTPDAEEDFTEGNTLTYTVLMGGDKVEKTTVGTITYTYKVDKVTVAFVDATGTTIQTKDLEVGTAITAPATNPTKDDVTKEDGKTYTYTFKGWAETADATEVVDFTDLKVTKAVTYYPIFTEAEKEVGGGEDENVTISYQLVKVDVSSTTVDTTVSTADIAKGAVIYTSVTEPTLSGYGFVGWYTDEALTTKLDKALTATEATTIYAKMAKLYKPGNINNDKLGLINSADASVLIEWINAGKPAHDMLNKVLPGTSVKFGNINGDRLNLINSADASVLIEWINAGKPSTGTYGTYLEITKD